MSTDAKATFEEVDHDLQKEAIGEVHGVEANPAAAALAAATAVQKPRMFSRGMIRLWLIVCLCNFETPRRALMTSRSEWDTSSAP